MAVPLTQVVSRSDDFSTAPAANLPSEVTSCLEDGRFLHLATCHDNKPHTSLMNYTFLSSSPFSNIPVIIMTTTPTSRSAHNLSSNTNVSLLLHDWVSAKRTGTNLGQERARDISPPPPAGFSLSQLMLRLNRAALAQISVTIDGTAKFLESGTDEELYYRDQHVRNHRLNDNAESGEAGDGGKGVYIEAEQVRVLLVPIQGIRVSDSKGGIKDYAFGHAMVNGDHH